MLVRSLALVLALLSFGGGSAHAATLRTVFIGVLDGQQLRVEVTNLGKKPITDLTVTLTERDGDADAPSTDVCADGPLLPRHTCRVSFLAGHSGFVTVTGKGKLSAGVNVVDSTTQTLSIVVPATK